MARDRLRVGRTAALTIVNAMIFQQVLSEHDRRVPPLARALEGPNVAHALSGAWRVILGIDYIPIFRLALDLVAELTGTPDIDRALEALANAAQRITARRAALRHDLMGRIFHRLLTDAKFFGAYYTTVPAATLLLKLTLEPSLMGVEWADKKAIQALRIGDLACGTGTLLKAALQTVVDNHVRAAAERHEAPNLRDIHRVLIEDVLWGLDVVPFAIHLAASALALHEPEVQFDTMNLFTLPLHGPPATRLGSIELFHSRQVSVQASLFGAATGATRTSGAGDVVDGVDTPRLDLCVMNPPFTRSVGGNLLFGNLPKVIRAKMQKDLKRLVQRMGLSANITAGLGSVFAALGHQQLKPDGQLALVMPRALLSGVAWKPTRELIGKHYHLRVVIVSHEPGAWNFSENTSLSECLLVAQRLPRGESAGPTKFVNLWRRPRNSIEALAVAQQISTSPGAKLTDPAGTDELTLGERKAGEVILVEADRIRKGFWNDAAAFAQTELCRVAFVLSRGRLHVPSRGLVGEIPVTRLRDLGELGPDVRDIGDGFRVSSHATSYAAFLGHETERIRQMAQTPSGHLSALARAKPGRPLRDADLLWERAGRVLVAERLRLTTTRVVAVRLPRKVLSNTWWPIGVRGASAEERVQHEKVLTLWLNSTLGVVSLAAARVDTEGPWIKLKKPILHALTVLDPTRLSDKQRRQLVAIYDEIAERELDRLPQMDADPVRARIDLGITKTLGLDDDLSAVRTSLAREPLLAV